MPTEIRNLLTSGNKEVPDGTEIVLQMGDKAGTINVGLKLPGASKIRLFKNVEIEEGTVYLPVSMVFICYAREDIEEVQSLSKKLWDDGFLVWMDKNDLKPGDKWRDVIDDAIERSDFVLVALSNNSCTKTGEVQREIKYALEQRKLRPSSHRYIIPVLLSPCDPPSEFREIHWADLSEPGGYRRLCDAISVASN